MKEVNNNIQSSLQIHSDAILFESSEAVKMIRNLSISTLDALHLVHPELITLFRSEGIYTISQIIDLDEDALKAMYDKGGNGRALLSEFKMQLLMRAKLYCKLCHSYEEYRKQNSISDDVQVESLELFLLFMESYPVQSHRRIKNITHEIMPEYLGTRGSVERLADIAESVGLTYERIRQVIIMVNIDLQQTLSATDGTGDSIRFIKEIRRQAQALKAMKYQKFITNIKSGKVVNRCLALYGYALVDTIIIKHGKKNVINILVPNDEKNKFELCVVGAINEMRQRSMWMTIDKVVKLQPDSNDKYSATEMRRILLSHPFIEIGMNGEEVYRVKWKYLSRVSFMAERILVDIGKPMTLAQIREEYEIRAARYGRDSVMGRNMGLTCSTHFSSKGKSGVWVYSPEPIVDKMGVRDVMQLYCEEHNGYVDFKDLYKYVSDKGYSYAPATLRYYILKTCIVSIKDSNIMIHKDYLEQNPDTPVLTKDMIAPRRGRRSLYHEEIEKTVEDYLANQPLHEALLRDVTNIAAQALPEGKPVNMLYAMLGRSPKFQKYKKPGTKTIWIKLIEP